MSKRNDIRQVAKFLFPLFIVLGVGIAQFQHWLGLGNHRVAEVPHYVLTDQSGQLVTEKTYLGKYQLIYFGYTFCPDVCPTSLATISGALDQMGDDAAKVVPILITIDPDRDTPAMLGDYVRQFRADMIGLSGTAVQTTEAVKQFGAVYGRHDAPEGYTMDHSADIYLVGPDGRYLTTISHGATTERLKAVLQKEIM